MTNRDVDSHVGKRLKARRTVMGLSQEALAKAVGITFQQVQKYEKGTNAMNATRLSEFARFMHVPVAYFFEGEEAAPAGGLRKHPLRHLTMAPQCQTANRWK